MTFCRWLQKVIHIEHFTNNFLNSMHFQNIFVLRYLLIYLSLIVFTHHPDACALWSNRKYRKKKIVGALEGIVMRSWHIMITSWGNVLIMISWVRVSLDIVKVLIITILQVYHWGRYLSLIDHSPCRRTFVVRNCCVGICPSIRIIVIFADVALCISTEMFKRKKE